MTREEAWAHALLEIAAVEDALGHLERDLHAFARAFEAHDNLRMALTDVQTPAERRIAIIEELMGGRAHPLATAMVSFIVSAGRARELPRILDTVVAHAAARRDHVVAEVRTAIELDDEQRRQLAEALSRATGRQVELMVTLDPSILGGVVAQVGDTVFDGSVRHRLAQLRERL